MGNDPDYSNIDPRSETNQTGTPFVRLERNGQVAELILDRPEKLNAWAWAPTNELCALADELRFDTSIRVVILRAEGRAFCAGEDLQPKTPRRKGAPPGPCARGDRPQFLRAGALLLRTLGGAGAAAAAVARGRAGL